MKNKKPILIAIITSLFAVLTVINLSLASPKPTGENTLDMLEIMTRAFDESEGGEGGGLHPTGNCKDLPPESPYWIKSNKMKMTDNVYDHVVWTASGWWGLVGNKPVGAIVINEDENYFVGAEFNCVSSWSYNKCCQLDVGIVYIEFSQAE